MSRPGALVVIAGTTGSGKSTSCRALCDAADELWLHFGMDTFFGTLLSRKFVDGGPRCHETLHMEPLDPARPVGPAQMKLGPLGLPLIDTMHHMAAAAARGGRNVVMDHVPTVNPPLLASCVTAFRDLPVLFVALKPDRQVLMQRIDDRLPEVVKILGAEQAQVTNERCKFASDFIYDEIFRHDRFDLVLDTAALSPPEVAQAILRRLQAGPGEAFPALARELGL